MVLKKYNYVNKNRMIQILIVPLVDRSCGNYVNQNELLILKKKKLCWINMYSNINKKKLIKAQKTREL